MELAGDGEMQGVGGGWRLEGRAWRERECGWFI